MSAVEIAVVMPTCRRPDLLWRCLALGALMGFAFKRLRGAALAPSRVAEMPVTSFAIPYLAVYWRFVGAWRFRVLFI